MAPSRSRLPASLVVAQIALTQPALLAMGALFLQMVESVREMPRAVQADRIHRRALQHQPAIRIDGRPARTGAGPPADAVRGAARSGRRRAAGECRRLVSKSWRTAPDEVPGVELPSSLDVRAHAAPTGYFSLMRIPVVLGRDFDRAGGDPPGAVVIGADLARRLWGEAGPIGRRIVSVGGSRSGSGTFTVIGVVDDRGASGNARDGPDLRAGSAGDRPLPDSDAGAGAADHFR